MPLPFFLYTQFQLHERNLQKLLNYINENYVTENIIIVFSPDSDENLIEMVSKNNFQTILLKTDNIKDWEFPNDSHWTCHGHKEVAKQVWKSLDLIMTKHHHIN